MNRGTAILSLIALLVFLLAGVAWARSSSGCAISWWVMSSGGASTNPNSEGIVLNGSLGQSAVGTSGSGHYVLGAGYWSGERLSRETAQRWIYLPMIFRSA